MLIYEGRGTILVMMIGYLIIAAIVTWLGKQGKKWELRRLAPLDAIIEGIGRAVELGKAVHFSLGVHVGQPGDPGQSHAYPVLRYVARECAARDCTLIATCARGDMLPILESLVREGAIEAGKPDWFKLENCRFLTQNQWAYSAGVFGILTRENVATNLLFGFQYGSLILLCEAGRIAGCLNIGGMARRSGELGFFALGCDYFLVLGEMVAAAAYLSEDPDQLSTVAGQDYFKFIIVALIIIGAILSTMGIDFLSKILAW